MAVSAYIHIPFCSHKCDFCDFAAFAGMDHLEDEYTGVVCEEIDSRSRATTFTRKLRSVFYGGGTPGLIRSDNLERIHRSIERLVGVDEAAEVTVETTPHAITADKVRSWLSTGVNRVSIGVETFQDSELVAIGRDHTQEQALKGIALACENGCENVSCDFMYALPTQTLESWRSTLDLFARTARTYPQIKHVSAYGLHIANNSPLFSRFPKDSESYPDDDVFSTMYEHLIETLESAGFHQYEVSNFARDGYQSSHNLSYWENCEYLGFGVSAHRYVQSVRSSNWRSLARYMKDFLGSETEEVIDPPTRMREAIMLGLRMRAGIDLEKFKNEFDVDVMLANERVLPKLFGGGFIEVKDGRLRLTQKGVPISNSIIAELI